jgi:hypothetical protein
MKILSNTIIQEEFINNESRQQLFRLVWAKQLLSCLVINKFLVNSCVRQYFHYILEQATKAQRGVEVQLYCFFNLGTKWCGWSAPRPGRFTLGKDRYPLYRRLGWLQGRSGRARKIAPPGLIRGTVQLIWVAYNDYAVPVPNKMLDETENTRRRTNLFAKLKI